MQTYVRIAETTKTRDDGAEGRLEYFVLIYVSDSSEKIDRLPTFGFSPGQRVLKEGMLDFQPDGVARLIAETFGDLPEYFSDMTWVFACKMDRWLELVPAGKISLDLILQRFKNPHSDR